MYEANVLRVLIASPSDVEAERKLIPQVLNEWNALHSLDLGIVLLPVKWETHARPELGDRPQAIINKQLVQNCDWLIGTFWTRLGTQTGVADSGTVEEIQEFRAAGKQVLLYFSNRPAVPESIDREQYDRLLQFKGAVQQDGLTDHYDTLEELRDKVSIHITHLAREWRQQHRVAGADRIAVPVAQPVEPESDPRAAVLPALETLQAEWIAERDSRPHNIVEAKSILHRVGRTLLNVRPGLVGTRPAEDVGSLDELVRWSKEIQKHQLYIDGGASYRTFWEAGDKIVDDAIVLMKAAP